MVRFARLVLIGSFLVMLFSLSMVLSYSLPGHRIRSHVQTSIKQLELEWPRSTSLVALDSFLLDNYSDSIMLNQALRQKGVGPVKSAFGNYMLVIKNSAENNLLPLKNLQTIFKGNGRSQLEQNSYARYWHGYQVFLRPLLIFFDYGAIRWLNAYILTACVLTVTALLRHRLNLGVAIAFLMALEAAGIVAVPMSIHYSSVFYVMLAGITAVALGMNAQGIFRFDIETFFILGAFTSFVDLLTAPLLTLGMPLGVLLLKRMWSDSESRFSRQFECFIKMSCAWVTGYIGCWASKWIISSLILGRNILADAVQSVIFRLNGIESGFDHEIIKPLFYNIAMLFPIFGAPQPLGPQWDIVAAALVVPTSLVLVSVVLLMRHMRTDGKRLRILGLLPVAMLPFAWYLVVRNHSMIHFYFTYRSLAISIFTLVTCMFYLFDPCYLNRIKVKIESYFRRPA